jgi:N,N'-diacetyllegionaminate synthase
MPHPIHIIAEAGTNHNGDFSTALRLIDMAAKCGADSVKFQIINPHELYLPAFYQNDTYVENPIVSARMKFMLQSHQYPQLANYAKSQGIPLSASVFDGGALGILLSCQPPYIKIASCDLNNIAFLRTVTKAVGTTSTPIILSTGFSTLQEIERAINEITKSGSPEVILMHCVSIYPAKLHQMNLKFIDTLVQTFGMPVGLSDHTDSSLAAAVAVSKGAAFLEKHITLDRSQDGFDHSYAMEKDAFAKYVQDVRDTYTALNHQGDKVTPEEAEVRQRARRSLYAARDLTVNELIRERDVVVLRPESHMPADAYDHIVGKRCKTELKKYQPFSDDNIL